MRVIIQTDLLSRSFDGGDSYALKDVSLNILEGEVVILRGISGSGKSTLLNLIAGIDRPTYGKVTVLDKPFIKLSDRHLSRFRRHNIAMIFQQFNLLEHLSVEENLFASIAPKSLSLKKSKKDIEDVLTLAQIAHKRDSIAASLSGGEKQRVAIARALMNNPQIILCDEPTANLDRENSLLFISLLEQLHKMNKTIVVATHDPLFETLPFDNKTINIKDGQIYESDIV
jgi:putative ABC transport system ATP-binding protein